MDDFSQGCSSKHKHIKKEEKGREYIFILPLCPSIHQSVLTIAKSIALFNMLNVGKNEFWVLRLLLTTDISTFFLLSKSKQHL